MNDSPHTPTTTKKTHRLRGVLEEKTQDKVVVSIPETNYRLHLATLNEVATEIGNRIVGTIRLKAAKRFDVVKSGGRYIEPLYGQPRRIQGDIVDVDTANNTITVNAAAPIVVTVNEVQKATDFEVGQFVAGDVMSNATFSPAPTP
ncbi:MAG: hypothetical protein AAGH64_09350 [Planctomycetota bacterium]